MPPCIVCEIISLAPTSQIYTKTHDHRRRSKLRSYLWLLAGKFPADNLLDHILALPLATVTTAKKIDWNRRVSESDAAQGLLFESGESPNSVSPPRSWAELDSVPGCLGLACRSHFLSQFGRYLSNLSRISTAVLGELVNYRTSLFPSLLRTS